MLQSSRCCDRYRRRSSSRSCFALLGRLHAAFVDLRAPCLQRRNVGKQFIRIGDCNAAQKCLVVCVVRALRHAGIDLGIVLIIDHNPGESLGFHALAETKDDLAQQDFFNRAFPCHAQSEIGVDGLPTMLLILAILVQLGDGLLLSL